MFCKYCGKIIDDDSVFCDGCGKNLKEKGTKTVYVQTTVKDSSYKTAPEASPKTQYSQPVKPNPVPQQSNDYTQAPRVEKKTQDFQQPTMVNPTPTQKAEIPDTPLKEKKSIVPYILLPIAVIIASLVNTAMPLLTGLIVNPINVFLMNEVGVGPLTPTCLSSFLTTASGILPTLIVLVLFSLCCKGFNKKFRFISSFYAAGVGSIILTIISVIIGYIILYAVGFYEMESMSIYSTIVLVCELFAVFILLPLLALLWFAMSEKYTVIKEEKSQPVKIVLPCIFIVIYGLMTCVFDYIQEGMHISLYELFGEFSSSFAFRVSSLITTSAALIILFLFALACKGGYRKLTFIGSIYFARTVFSPLPNVFQFIFSIISEEDPITMFQIGNTIGGCLKGILVIALSIVLYIMMNRYSVEKIKKIKE